MMTNDPFTASDATLILDLVLAVALVLVFALGNRAWVRDRLGWVIFYYGLATVALLGLIVFGIVAGQKVDEPVRLAVAGALAVALGWKTYAIIDERRRGRRERMRAAEEPPTEGNPMTEKLIPANASLAAKRGFIRTTAQAYGTALAGGITAVALTDAIGQVQSGNPLPLIVTTAVTVVSPLIAGAASFFSILSRGIPADYEPAEPETPVV